MADLPPQSSRLKRLGRSLKQLIVPRSEYVLDGRRFRSDGTIAEGGFSVVERVIELDPDGGAETGRCFALKIMVVADEETDRDVRREIRAHEVVDHPNLMPLLAQGRRALRPRSGATAVRPGAVEVLLLFPLYPSGSLWSAATRPWAAPGVKTVANAQVSSALGVQPAALPRSHMPEGVLLRAFRGVVGATVALHGCGLAHLDIKPQNILMRNDRATAEANAGGATLMDLGSAQPRWTKIVSARDARALEERCADKCTMPYRAPELFRVDWRRVAAGVKRLAILSASYDLPPRDTHVYSDRVAELIASMLQEDPDARPTAREVELATAEAIAALEEEVHTAALGAAEVDAAAEKTPSLEPPPESPPSAAELSEWDPFGTGGNALDVDKPKLGAAAGHGALCDVPSGTEQVVSDRPAVETARPPRRLSSANLSPDVKALIQSLDASAREMEVDAETARSEAAGALAEHTKARLAVERAEAVQLERAARMAALMNAEVEGAARVNATSAAAEVREQSGNSASGTAAALFQGAGGGRSSPDVRGESADARAEAAAERAARARAQSAERWQTMGIVELAGEMAALKAARFELQDKMERQAAALRKAGAKGRLEMAAYDRALAHTDALIAQYEARVEELRLEDDV